MTEQGNPPKETELYAAFEYGRDLYMQLFQDDTPLVNLGYTPRQKILARRALSLLENEGTLRLGYRPRLTFEPENNHSGSETLDDSAGIERLTHEGYQLSGYVTVPWPKGDYSQEAEDFVRERFGFFESESTGKVVDVRVIPAQIDYTNLDRLVRHLYEGTDYGDVLTPSLEPESLSARLKKIVIPSVATYKAVWIDDETKLELVIESDFQNRSWGEGGKDIDIWRRLPQIELDGKSWTPFGKKPNISKQAAQKALQGAKSRVIAKQFATDKGQV